MPVRSDAGVDAQCFASLSARGCLRTRRDELVGTLSEQQIGGEQGPNVGLLLSAKEEIAENDLSSPKTNYNTIETLVWCHAADIEAVYWSLFQWTLQNVGVEACRTVALYPIFSMSV